RLFLFFFSSRRRHTRFSRDWSSDVCSSDLAQVTVPVTYAEVWEFWLSNRELSDAVDFVTIHILPYWENIPIRADLAAAHADEIQIGRASCRERVEATAGGAASTQPA